MGIYDFLKRKILPIDFSDENVSELNLKSDLLGQTLIHNKLGFYVDHLSQIQLSADKKDEAEFRKLVISRELFGGAGALWEIHIENPTEYKKFNKQFIEYIDLLKRMGIKNGRVNQIRKTMPTVIKIKTYVQQLSVRSVNTVYWLYTVIKMKNSKNLSNER